VLACLLACLMAPATTSASIDNLAAVHESIIHAPEEAFDPLPDETVLKTGWLYKKGRRGVSPSTVFQGLTTELEETMVRVAVRQTCVL
jgi:hypothetical protein